jgi:phytoene desaturase
VDSPAALVRTAWRLRDLYAIAPGRSLRWLGRRYLGDARLRMLLDRYATYAGADPRRAPAALVAIPYAELTFGGWHPRGGMSTLTDALVRRCQAWGVDIRTGTPVARVETAGGAVTGVRLADGRPVPADVVVSNVDALALYRDLLPHPRRAARLADRSLSGFVLLLGRRALATDDGGSPHTVYFPADYDAEFDDVFGGRPATDPAVFVGAATAPPGHEARYVLVNAPPQGPVDWRRPGLADAYADRVLDLLARRGADLRDRIVFRVIRTPADLAEATASPDGAIYGTAGHRLLRPANRGPVRGLYLVGGSTHPGGGLPLATLSAKIVADLIPPP